MFSENDPSVPIGRPLTGRSVYLTDKRGGLVPLGVAGELWITGLGLARGYANRPDLTAALFTPDPFGTMPGGRVYRSGDRCRVRPDGLIEFLGRVDRQLKIRGFRVEPGEIESAIRECEGVRQSIVIPYERDGNRSLAAFVVMEPDRDRSDFRSPLTDQARALLPEYMIPSLWLRLDKLPISRNGKPDRRRLLSLALADTRNPPANDAVPVSEMEKIIAGVWERVLGLDRVGVNDHFFEIGGHSLSLIRVKEKLTSILNRDIPLIRLLEFPTISRLAGFLGSDSEPVRPVTSPNRLLYRKNTIMRKQKRRDHP